jgi:nascent polypeptide-associated complex subunit beta
MILFKKLQKKSGTGRIGGKGTVRRKNKPIVRNKMDDKRLKAQLQRIGVRDIPAIEEVNLFKDDGNVIHFNNPKVQASIQANTYVISGTAEDKKLQELLPGILNQLGPNNVEQLKEIYQSFAGAAGAGADDDDDVPELVDNFEAVSKGDDDDVPDLE